MDWKIGFGFHPLIMATWQNANPKLVLDASMESEGKRTPPPPPKSPQALCQTPPTHNNKPVEAVAVLYFSLLKAILPLKGVRRQFPPAATSTPQRTPDAECMSCSRIHHGDQVCQGHA